MKPGTFLSRRGFSLIEVVVAGGLLTIIGAIVAASVSMAGKMAARTTKDNEAQADFLRVSNFIHRVGRSAVSCAEPSANVLECQHTFGDPDPASAKGVRFRLEVDHLIYEHETSPGTWETQIDFGQAVEFTVCGVAEMQAATCPIPSSLWAPYLLPSPVNWPPVLPGSQENRFFRFRVGLLAGPVGDQHAFQHLSSFFVRQNLGLSDIEGFDWW